MSDKYAYRVVWSEDDKEYVGVCAEFPSLSWLDKSQDNAFKGIRNLVAETIEDLKSHDELIPEPLSSKKFSGKFMVRVTPARHRELVLEAKENKVSLNRYVNDRLAGHV